MVCLARRRSTPSSPFFGLVVSAGAGRESHCSCQVGSVCRVNAHERGDKLDSQGVSVDRRCVRLARGDRQAVWGGGQRSFLARGHVEGGGHQLHARRRRFAAQSLNPLTNDV